MMSCHHRILSPCFFSVSSSFFSSNIINLSTRALTFDQMSKHWAPKITTYLKPQSSLLTHWDSWWVLLFTKDFQILSNFLWFLIRSFQEESFDRMLRRHVVVRNDIWRQKVIKIREGFSSIRLFPPPGLNFEINLPFLLLLLFFVFLYGCC